MSSRDYDIAVFGATGFTGALTAEHLARRAPAGTRVALAGRDAMKLAAVRERMAAIEPRWSQLPLVEANVEDAGSLRALARSSRVLISAVGPYIFHGEPVVAACASEGTDYVDLTGEALFVDRMWLRYHEQARRSGARIVHSCGWTALPHDLGTLYTVDQLPEGEPIDVSCFMRVSSVLSGGSFISVRANLLRSGQMAWTGVRRARLERESAGRRARLTSRLPALPAHLSGWRLPYPTLDRQTAVRSARALERYGPDFRYGQFFLFEQLAPRAALAALATHRRSGEGPDAERRATGWFTDTFVGQTPSRRVVTEVSGADPWYTEASKMLGEAALCLAHDELPATAGQVTPAAAMGQPLIDRLVRVGIRFRVLEAPAVPAPAVG